MTLDTLETVVVTLGVLLTAGSLASSFALCLLAKRVGYLRGRRGPAGFQGPPGPRSPAPLPKEETARL